MDRGDLRAPHDADHYAALIGANDVSAFAAATSILPMLAITACAALPAVARSEGSERRVERATGIEPVSEAWEASVLPLY